MNKKTKHYCSWTKEKIKQDALKYTGRKEWSEKSSGAYSKASKGGFLNSCCLHMTDKRK